MIVKIDATENLYGIEIYEDWGDVLEIGIGDELRIKITKGQLDIFIVKLKELGHIED